MTGKKERRSFDPDEARARAADAAFDEGINLTRRRRVGFTHRQEEREVAG